MVNSVTIAISEYTCIDNSGNPVAHGFDPRYSNKQCYSMINQATFNTDIIFIVIFTLEAILKIIAMGFMYGE